MMNRKPQHYKLKNRLFVSIALLVFVSVLLVSTIGSAQFSQHLVEQNTAQTQQLIDQLALNASNYISELSRLCMSPYYSEQVMKLLDTPVESSAEQLEKRRNIENYLREVMTIPRKDILRVNIMTDSVYSTSRTGYADTYSANFTEEAWYQSAIESSDAIFIPAHTESHGSYKVTVFSMVLRLQSLADSRKTLGVIRVDANYSGIKDVLDDVTLPDKGVLYIFDPDGSIIYQRGALQSPAFGKDIFDASQMNSASVRLSGEKYLLSSQQITDTNWTVVAANAESVLMHNVNSARRSAMLLAFVCAGFALAVTALFVRAFIRPLNKTMDTMRIAQQGDLSVRAEDSDAEEISYLNSTFNEMLQKISDTMEHNTRLSREMYEAKYLQKKAQYDALYNQIRPHFLFNTLSTISLLVKSKRNDDAVQGINELSILLRGMVNTDKDITLASELQIVKSYLSLQERRHDALSYIIQADDAVLDSYIPALTIQPIVENALIHGCEPRRSNSEISISAHADGDNVIIRVTDNGVGMDEIQLAALQEAVDGIESTPTKPGSVGLYNIAQRLRLRFGEPYGISVASCPNTGTTVTITIPGTSQKEALLS